MVRNFIEFLYIFGHFVSNISLSVQSLRMFMVSRLQAGEDLEEIEEEEEPGDEEEPLAGETPYYGTSGLPEPPSIGPSPDGHKPDEHSPLLQRSHMARSRSRRRISSVGPHGDATVTDAVLMVGTSLRRA